MQIAAEAAKFQSLSSAAVSDVFVTVWLSRQSALSRCGPKWRDGALVRFDPSNIPVTVARVFVAADSVQGASGAELQPQVIDDPIGQLRAPGFPTGSTPSGDPLVGPVG